jgi:hypothetical protein
MKREQENMYSQQRELKIQKEETSQRLLETQQRFAKKAEWLNDFESISRLCQNLYEQVSNERLVWNVRLYWTGQGLLFHSFLIMYEIIFLEYFIVTKRQAYRVETDKIIIALIRENLWSNGAWEWSLMLMMQSVMTQPIHKIYLSLTIVWLFHETPSRPIVEVGSILRWKQFFHWQNRWRECDNGNGIQTLATAKKLDISSKNRSKEHEQLFKARENLDLNSVHVRYDVQAIVWTKNECRER